MMYRSIFGAYVERFLGGERDTKSILHFIGRNMDYTTSSIASLKLKKIPTFITSKVTSTDSSTVQIIWDKADILDGTRTAVLYTLDRQLPAVLNNMWRRGISARAAQGKIVWDNLFQSELSTPC